MKLNKLLEFLTKIQNMDRRIIFVLIWLAVMIPLLYPMGMSVEVSPPVQRIYDFVETLPEGSLVWVGFDYYATTETECTPAVTSFVRHCFSRDLKIMTTSTIPDGNALSQRIMGEVADEYKKVYGKDYVILGYKPGGMVAISQVCENLRTICPTDINNTSIDEIPLLANVKGAGDISMVFTSTDNQTFDDFVKVASTQYHIPMAGSSTAVSVPQLYIYLDSGQAMGVLGGLKGAAEYELLIHQKGTATAGMDAQSIVHILIVFLLLLSNVSYFMEKKIKAQEKAQG